MCRLCGRSFSRNDILRKHIAVHDTAHVPIPKGRMACDGCHRNKSKCDGDGVRCSSCDKRGAKCTFDRAPASMSKPADRNLDPAFHSSSDTGPARSMEVTQPLVADDALFPVPLEVDALQGHSDGERQIAHSSLRYILDCVMAAIAGKPGKLLPSTAPEHVQLWQKTCLSNYVATFHERWPVAHAPTLDAECDDPLFVGTVLMISAWNQDDENLKRIIMPIHERLMVHIQQKIVVASTPIIQNIC